MSEEKKIKIEDLPEQVQKNVEAQLSEMETLKQIEEDLRTNPKYKKFYERFNIYSVESFPKEYAQRKLFYIKYGESNYKRNQERLLKYRNEAFDCLWHIQQKKLFNLQCEWRAEKITLPEIRMSLDFEYWEDNIQNCNFIPPITEDEVELYKQFLESEDFDIEPLGWLSSWQDYDEYKADYESDDEDGELITPEWYMFYDSRRGTGTLLTLPDLRGDKEEFYRDLFFQKHKKEREEEIEKQKKEGTYVEPVRDTRPSLSVYNNVAEFVEMFEDEKTKRFSEAFELNYHKSYEEEQVESAYCAMQDIEEKIPIDGWYDWREALIKAFRKYEARKIYECMDAAYAEYLSRKEMGISYEEGHQKEHHAQIFEMVSKQIIEGRILNGEPGDFNF